MKITLASGLVAALTAVSSAEIVHVEIRGTVESNAFTTGVYAGQPAGSAALITFDVDSDNFVNSPQWPVRGYPIIQSSFVQRIGTAQAGFPNPMPPNVTPFFSIRNNDPRVDGFLISSMVDFPARVPMAIGVNNMGLSFLRTFSTDTILPSLDILDAVGTYGFEFMSSYGWGVGIGDFDLLLVMYESITISRPTPPCDPDINCDGVPDQGDVACMILAVAGDMGCFCQADPDFNRDGVPDQGDVADVILTVAGAPCP